MNKTNQSRKTKNKNNVSEKPNITEVLEGIQRAHEIRREAVEATKSADRMKEEWLAIRKDAGRKIDPETAEERCVLTYDSDPYCLEPDHPWGNEVYGIEVLDRHYFVRSPGSDIWVWFWDLPDATKDRLRKKQEAKLAVPAGLPVNPNDKWHGQQPDDLTDDYLEKLIDAVPNRADSRPNSR